MRTLHCNNTVPDFSAEHSPAMSVALDEQFVVETHDRFEGTVRGEPPAREIVTAMVGPVYVEGITAGDLMAINVHEITPRTGTGYMLTSPGFGILGDRVERRAKAVAVDPDGIRIGDDTTLAYRPMIGKLGIAPADGALPDSSCGTHGGALSNIQLGPGATLLLRAQVDGGGICLEDVHGAMGDGEATASAVEMAARVTLSCSRWDDRELPAPMIVTEADAITLGQGETLDEAAAMATEAMLALIMRRGVDFTEAAMLVGAAVDVRLAFFGARPHKAYAVVQRELTRLAR